MHFLKQKLDNVVSIGFYSIMLRMEFDIQKHHFKKSEIYIIMYLSRIKNDCKYNEYHLYKLEYVISF